MRDRLDPSLNPWAMAPRALGILAVLILGVPLGCQGVFYLTHPAPLGRSPQSMLQHVDAALPVGTSVDSAIRFLKTVSIQYDVETTPRDLKSYRDDTLFAGGPIVVAVEPSVARTLLIYDGFIYLYFTPEGRLAHRSAELTADDPL